MRISAITLCTLGVLTACDLKDAVRQEPKSDLANQDADAADSIATSELEKLKLVEATASPELFLAQQFTAKEFDLEKGLNRSVKLGGTAQPPQPATSRMSQLALRPIRTALPPLVLPDLEELEELEEEIRQIRSLSKPSASVPNSEAKPGRLSDTAIEVEPDAEQTAEQLRLADLQDHWAENFIQVLADKSIVQGFPDGTFRPDQPVTQAQFAKLLQQAFSNDRAGQGGEQTEVDTKSVAPWANDSSIQAAATIGHNTSALESDQSISRGRALALLANGLNLKSSHDQDQLNQYFKDADQVPADIYDSLLAAAEHQLVVNDPDPHLLNPDQVATRADVVAFIHQALVAQEQLSPLAHGAIATRIADQHSHSGEATTLDESLISSAADAETKVEIADIHQSLERDALEATLDSEASAPEIEATNSDAPEIVATKTPAAEASAASEAEISAVGNFEPVWPVVDDRGELEAGAIANPETHLILAGATSDLTSTAVAAIAPVEPVWPVDDVAEATINFETELVELIELAEATLGQLLAPPTAATTTVSQSDRSAIDSTYTLRAGDRIRVDIFNTPEYSGAYEISADGSIEMPLLGTVSLADMTFKRAGNAIAAQYASYLSYHPVTVTLLPARPVEVSVTGEVNQPGSYSLPVSTGTPMPTITQAIQAAGGMTSLADIQRIQIHRALPNSLSKMIEIDFWQYLQAGDASQDVALRPGDRVIIPATEALSPAETEPPTAFSLPDEPEIDVIGGVEDSGAIQLPLSVFTQALQSISGVDSETIPD
ncbi:MAG: hypothetical protein F6K19_01815 [Cyanothece sp. SIO1E1]|nr:hypothetical protein [Cyanothece sp. SIO1E1]